MCKCRFRKVGTTKTRQTDRCSVVDNGQYSYRQTIYFHSSSKRPLSPSFVFIIFGARITELRFHNCVFKLKLRFDNCASETQFGRSYETPLFLPNDRVFN
jgi:hypothetical protein